MNRLANVTVIVLSVCLVAGLSVWYPKAQPQVIIREVIREVVIDGPERIVYLPHPSRDLAEAPIVQHFDNYTSLTTCSVMWTDYNDPRHIQNRRRND